MFGPALQQVVRCVLALGRDVTDPILNKLCEKNEKIFRVERKHTHTPGREGTVSPSAVRASSDFLFFPRFPSSSLMQLLILLSCPVGRAPGPPLCAGSCLLINHFPGDWVFTFQFGRPGDHPARGSKVRVWCKTLGSNSSFFF